MQEWAEPMEERAKSMEDDLGVRVELPRVVRRVVSIVPSLTEAIAVTAPGLLVGATDWCTHPADLDVTRIGGTKNPDVAAIVALGPDLVVANEEENREVDLKAMRAAGLAVWVTRVRTLPEALVSLRRMLTLGCRCDSPDWLAEAEAAWAAVPAESDRGVAVVPIWRRPWMVVGRDTFTGDVLSRLGVRNAFAAHPERYPRIALEQLRAERLDLVVLPDEPYLFTPDDGPEAFAPVPAALVSGRYLTWYGPSLVQAPAALSAQLDAAR
jgi:ABC-type Fe3+-hydroxamate transport system substrate-binding protein